MTDKIDELQLLLEIWTEISDEGKSKLLEEAIRLRYEPTLVGGPFDGYCPRGEPHNGYYFAGTGGGQVAVYQETEACRFVFQGTKPFGEGSHFNCFPGTEGEQ